MKPGSRESEGCEVLAGSPALGCPGFPGPGPAWSQSTAQGQGQEDMPARVQRVRVGPGRGLDGGGPGCSQRPEKAGRGLGSIFEGPFREPWGADRMPGLGPPSTLKAAF